VPFEAGHTIVGVGMADEMVLDAVLEMLKMDDAMTVIVTGEQDAVAVTVTDTHEVAETADAWKMI
jgi:hypothetical protein